MVQYLSSFLASKPTFFPSQLFPSFQSSHHLQIGSMKVMSPSDLVNKGDINSNEVSQGDINFTFPSLHQSLPSLLWSILILFIITDVSPLKVKMRLTTKYYKKDLAVNLYFCWFMFVLKVISLRLFQCGCKGDTKTPKFRVPVASKVFWKNRCTKGQPQLLFILMSKTN